MIYFLNLNLLRKIVFLVVFLFAITLISLASGLSGTRNPHHGIQSFPHYFGDIDFAYYLENIFCKFYSKDYQLIIIKYLYESNNDFADRNSTSQNDGKVKTKINNKKNASKSSWLNVLRRNQYCVYDYQWWIVRQNNSTNYIEKLIQNLFSTQNNFQTKKRIAILDFSFVQNPSNDTDSSKSTLSLLFAQFLQQIDVMTQIYSCCTRCKQIIAFFEIPFRVLVNFLHRIKFASKDKMRATLMSSTATDISIRGRDVAHIKPVLDGCYTYPGIYIPITSNDLARFRQNNCNLHQITLNISVNTIYPFCDIIRVNGQTVHSRILTIEKELLQFLKQKYNFTEKFWDNHKNWGTLTNKKWNGAMGQIANGSTNFGMCKISQTFRRSKYFDFSKIYFLDDLTIISTIKRNNKNENYISIRGGFSQNACIAIATISVVEFWVFYFANRKNFDLIKIMLIFVEVILRKSSLIGKNHSSLIRSLLVTIWFASSVFFIVYNANILSDLTIKRSESINTIDDFRRAIITKSHHFVIIKNTPFTKRFYEAKNKNSIFYKIGQNINKSKSGVSLSSDMTESMATLFAPLGTDLDSHSPTLGDQYHSIRKRPIAIIFLRSELRVQQLLFIPPRQRSNTHIARMSLGVDHVSFVFPQRSPLREPFDKIIMRVKELGFLKNWHQRAMYNLALFNAHQNNLNWNENCISGSADCLDFNEYKSRVVKHPFPLTIWQLRMLIYLNVFGHTLAVFALIGEVIHLFIKRYLK